MSSAVIKDNGNTPFGVKEIAVMSLEEMNNIDTKYYNDGSTCLIVPTCDVYMLMDRQWKKMGGD